MCLNFVAKVGNVCYNMIKQTFHLCYKSAVCTTVQGHTLPYTLKLWAHTPSCTMPPEHHAFTKGRLSHSKRRPFTA